MGYTSIHLRFMNQAVWGLMMGYHTGTYDRAYLTNRIESN